MPQQKNPWKIVIYLTLFQLSILFLYNFGPISYSNQFNSIKVSILTITYLLALNIGFKLSARFFISNRLPTKGNVVFINRSIVITLILSIPTILTRIGNISGVESIGDLYTESQTARINSDSTIEYIRIFFGFYTFGLLPVLLCSWNQIQKKNRLLALTATLAAPITSALTGVNKNFFDYLIILLAFYIIGAWSPLKNNGVNNIKKLIIAMSAGTLVFLSGLFFVEGQLTRYGSPAISGFNPRTEMTSEYNINDGKLLVFYSAMSSYLTQGYRAFELSLDENIDFNWGVSNSTFLSRQIDRIFGVDTSNKSLPAIIEKYGWDRYIDWSSFYVWMASDIGFYGLIPLMFIIGALFRLIINSVQYKKDIYSQVLLGYFIIGLFYLSANNQLLQSGESCIPFLTVLSAWLLTGKIKRIKGNEKINQWCTAKLYRTYNNNNIESTGIQNIMVK